MNSMTGYGKGEAVSAVGRCVVEIKTVNNRYSELSIKMPRSFMSQELDVRKQVSGRISRGKADLYVQWEPTLDATAVPPVNHAVAHGYKQAFVELAHDLHLSAEIPIALILSQKFVVQETSGEESEERFELLTKAVSQALDNLQAMRAREGASLTTDLTARRATIAQLVELVRDRSPKVVEEGRVRLEQRLEKLLQGSGVDPDPQRIAQELALLADRGDITEELVRLASHLAQFDGMVAEKEPVGRKLDFLMQEFNREINTIGSKANDAEITRLVVQLKAELEKMREQVQNIE